MSKFKYKAVSATGEVYEKIADAQDQYALAAALKEQGDTLVHAVPEKKKAWYERFNIDLGGIKIAERITFAKNLAAMVDAGLTVSRGLAIMERQTRSKKFKQVLAQVGTDVQKGTSLSQSLAKFPKVFDSLFVAMVHAGEESEKLGESLRTISEQMDRSFSLKRRIRGAMMYPSVIMVLMVIIGILMLIFVVPTLTATFKDLHVELPLSTQFIIVVSDGLVAQPVLYLGALVALVCLCVWALRTPRGKKGFEFSLMHLPVIKTLTQQTNAARMSRTFASLLSSGVDVVSSINITGEVLQNSYYKQVLAEAGQKIQKGETLSSVFSNHAALYPPMVVEMVAVGEETGKLPEMFLQIATFFEAEVDQKTKDLSSIVEPVLMVVIGAAVGFFAVSIITPIYSLSSSI
jgi:type IV pilus assembly protein PilC